MGNTGPIAFNWPPNEAGKVIGWGPLGRYLKNVTSAEILEAGLPDYFVTPALADGDCAAAARLAFDSGKPLLTTQEDVDANAVPSITINLTTEASADTETARHAVLEAALEWQATCWGIVPNIIIADGYYTVNGYVTIGHKGKLMASAAPESFTISAISTTAKSSTITVDAGTDVITHSIVGLLYAQLVTFTTTGTLPAGLALSTQYYVSYQSATTIKLAASASALSAGTFINITDAGSGVHTMTAVNLFTSTVTVTSALPSRVVAGYGLMFQNVRGDGHAEAMTGAHVVKTIAGDRLSFTIDHQVYGVAPTTITTIDSGADAELTIARSRVLVPRFCLRVNSAGYNGTAEDQEGYLNFERSPDYEVEYIGLSYNPTNYTGGSDEHDLVFGKRSNFKLLSCTFAGAGDKVIRLAYNVTAYIVTCGIGGGATGQQLYQGYGNSDVQFVRCSMGGASGEGISATVSSRVALPSSIVVSCARGVRTSYGDASVVLTGYSRIAHCNEGLRADTGWVQTTTNETVTKCTSPLSIQGPGCIYGSPTISSNTNTTIPANVWLNGGAWRQNNVQVPPVVFNSAIASQGPGFATATYLAGSSLLVSTGQLKAGSRCRWIFDVSKTAAGVDAPVIAVRYGGAGAIADTVRATLTFPAQTAAADDGRFVIELTFNEVGAASIQVVGTLTHGLAATGLSTSNSPTARATGSFTATANNYLGLSVNAGASAAWTVSMVHAVLENIN
jgi:hypothetical protein